jgi:4-alpha-glucanotransferase
MDLLAEAARVGIDTDYVDWRGQRRAVSPDVLTKLLDALRPTVGDEAPDPDRFLRAGEAYQGPAGRFWMLAVQLYGIRSRRNWGHGDFSDLLALIEWAGRLGAAGIGLNPLHALFDDRPGEPSPYSPNSRLFLNPLYIDVEAVEDFDDVRSVSSEIEQCRRAELVDYAAVAALKNRCLRLAYRIFREKGAPARRADFEAFRESRGSSLLRFASFEVLRRRLKGPWWEWPAEWCNPDEAVLQQLRREAEDEIGFFEYVQWNADRQLTRCRDRARALHMPIGLYLDIAVGVQAGGFDSWNEPRAVLRALAIGAPPDALNTAGQNWGLAGFSGAGLRARSFEPFRNMLAASMRYAAAIRLDHVLGLKRLYLIPEGMPPDQGAYVRLPFEQMLQITADESRASRCIVIGEDLGTIPENFRERTARWGLWSYRVMLFERGENGAFRPPNEYVERALVTFSTHDLPTFAGWASAHDVRVKRALNVDPGETDDERAQAIAQLHEALATRGIKQFDFTAVAAFLAATPAKLMVVGLEDVLGMKDQPNIPGTIDEYPNWRRKYPVDLEDLTASDVLDGVARVAGEHGRAAQSGAHPSQQVLWLGQGR